MAGVPQQNIGKIDMTETVTLGKRPPLEVVEKLPPPEEVFKIPRISARYYFAKVLGPAVIVLGAAIGSGEWLMGPAAAVKYGLLIFWLVWVASVLQTIFNMSLTRVTMAIGEPAVVYFSRIPPGPKFWSWFTPILLWLQMLWPGWALAAATGLGAAMLGRIPGPGEIGLVRTIGVVLFILCLVIVSFGWKIARTLEIFMWGAVIFVLASLIFFVGPLTIKAEMVIESLHGFASIGYLPPGIDILLLGGWWAYIAYASGNNWIVTNYYRDKGYGTSNLVGYIPAIIGGKKVPVSPVGKTFKMTDENLAVWKKWYKAALYDQWGIFFVGAMLGMMIPSLIAASLLPRGADLPAWGVAAHVAKEFAGRVGPWGFYFIALIGFFILFTTQLQIIDALMRNTVDALWGTSEKARKLARGDIRVLYYLAFVIYIIIASWAIFQAPPLILLLVGANMANFAGMFTVPAAMYMNSKLPKEIRPKMWEYVVLVIFWVFNIFFFTALTLYYGFGIRVL